MKADWLVGIAVAVIFTVGSACADDAKQPDADAKAATAKSAANDERLREIIQQVRQAEERYRNLETTVRITSQDEVSVADLNDRQNLSKAEETCYTLHQGDLFLFKRRESQSFGADKPTLSEQIAAFDGETTVSVVFGNSVNIFAGRHEPSRLYPPHTWCLRALWVSYPLSVYLQGTDAIKKHPKSFKSPGQRGRVFEIAKVEVSFEGEETVDGLECLKLASHHWCRETDPGQVAEIWLAPVRNYLCVKMTVSVGEGIQGMMRNETKVTEWTELKPGLWLPKRVRTTHYVKPRNGGEPVVRSGQTLLVDKATADATFPLARFRDVKVPEGLPTYKIDRDGFVESSAVKSVATPTSDPRELARILAELKRYEERYPRYDVSTTESYRAFEGRVAFAGTRRMDETERTISLPGKLYCVHVQESHGTARFASVAPVAGSGSAVPSDTVSRSEAAWDGQWLRSFHWYADKGDLPAEPRSISLQKGGPKGLAAFRPHSAVFSDHRMRARMLSDFLTAEYWDETNKYRYVVEYIGEETVDELCCAKLRLGAMFGDQKQPQYQFFFIWLAKDRNYLPVRSEHVDLAWSNRIPTGVAYVDDLREIAPGVWCPYHVIETAFDTWSGEGTGSGEVLINWRRERQVDNLNLVPDVPDELFSPTASSGVWVNVSNESGRNIGRFRQKENGPPQVADDMFTVMAEIARVDWHDPEDGKRRQAALDALIGTPLPEFGETTWLNSPPLSNTSLTGKVLLIEFWAEWWQPCERDLQTLAKAGRGLVADGITVVGIHPAGSDKQDIQDFADEIRLEYPIYVDRMVPGDTSRWGHFFEKLAVRELPHAFVVNRQGKIVAHGRLDQMISKARTLTAEK